MPPSIYPHRYTPIAIPPSLYPHPYTPIPIPPSLYPHPYTLITIPPSIYPHPYTPIPLPPSLYPHPYTPIPIPHPYSNGDLQKERKCFLSVPVIHEPTSGHMLAPAFPSHLACCRRTTPVYNGRRTPDKSMDITRQANNVQTHRQI